MTNNNKQWFDIDKAGLSKLLERRGIEFAVFELIQNAWDEAGVARVEVSLQPASQRGYSMLIVEDNSTNGFSDLRHAYTMFAESGKKGDAEKRGRFNIGEKLVLSLCKWAIITTTKGSVVFDKDGRSETKTCREFGTKFQALIKMDGTQRERVAVEIQKLISPAGIATTFNNDVLPDFAPRLEREMECRLSTEIAGADGILRRTHRNTTVRCYNVAAGEPAYIYEMGIPVCEHDCAFHVDVQQKVPLTIDRENVTTQFLREMRTAVFNATHTLLDSEEVNHEWTQTAIESGDAKPEAVRDYMAKRFGEQRASYDMSDPEANNKAVANGYTLVHGSMLSKTAWQAARGALAIEPAGRLFPTHSDNFVMGEPVVETENMLRVKGYTQQLAQALMGIHVDVRFCQQPSREVASYGTRCISFNVRNLGGDKWFDLAANRLAIDDLIIHEFGHEYASNHLSEAYNDALSRLAAKAMALGRAGKLPA